MDAEAVLNTLLKNPRFKKISLTAALPPAQEGVFRPIPAFLPVELSNLLHKKNITRLYSHQAEALEKAGRGQDFVVVTPPPHQVKHFVIIFPS